MAINTITRIDNGAKLTRCKRAFEGRETSVQFREPQPFFEERRNAMTGDGYYYNLMEFGGALSLER